MSVRVMTAAWSVDLPPGEKLVLLALADCANDEGRCWPGIKSLCAKTGRGERSLQGDIQALCKAGHLTREEVLGKGCNYTVHPQPTLALNPRKNCAPAKTAPPQKTAETPAESAGKPSRTINASEAKASSAKRAAYPPPRGVGAELWRDFKAVRDRKRAPITPTAYSRLCAKLAKLAEDGWPPGEMIGLAVERGWTSVFAPRDQANDQRSLSRTRPNLTDLHRAATAASRDLADRDRAGPALPALGNG